jgi:hypothetical protein
VRTWLEESLLDLLVRAKVARRHRVDDKVISVDIEIAARAFHPHSEKAEFRGFGCITARHAEADEECGCYPVILP